MSAELKRIMESKLDSLEEKFSKDDDVVNRRAWDVHSDKIERVFDEALKKVGIEIDKFGDTLKGEISERDKYEMKFEKSIKKLYLSAAKRYGIH